MIAHGSRRRQPALAGAPSDLFAGFSLFFSARRFLGADGSGAHRFRSAGRSSCRLDRIPTPHIPTLHLTFTSLAETPTAAPTAVLSSTTSAGKPAIAIAPGAALKLVEPSTPNAVPRLRHPESGPLLLQKLSFVACLRVFSLFSAKCPGWAGSPG